MMPSFREQVQSAWQQAQNDEAARADRERRHLEEQVRSEFSRKFGLAPDVVANDMAQCDMVSLRYNQRTMDWAVIGQCPRCGELCDSKAVFTLAQIGKELEDFVPDGWSHTCTAANITYPYVTKADEVAF